MPAPPPANEFRPARPMPTDSDSVQKLLSRSRELRRRLRNDDRQRLRRALRKSGHLHSLDRAPILLQQFFLYESDLDEVLQSRYTNAPLISHVRFTPKPGQPMNRLATAAFASQDDALQMTVDAHRFDDGRAAVEFTFTLYSALAMRFRIDPLLAVDRAEWLTEARRDDGMSILWTRERWERPYILMVRREKYARLYAFTPEGLEAATRLTPDMAESLTQWLHTLWFPSPALGARAGSATDDDTLPTPPTPSLLGSNGAPHRATPAAPDDASSDGSADAEPAPSETGDAGDALFEEW